MSHCQWCHYDGAPHAECEAKMERRARIDAVIKPALSSLGFIVPERGNLSYRVAMLIEEQLDK